jgi:penicillin-binding protein 2
MRFYRLLSLTVTLALLAGCNGQNSGATPTGTSTLPTPVVRVTQPPVADPQSTMRTFLDAWQKDDYASMYPLISQDSQAGITLDDFTKRYSDAMNSLTLKEMSYEVSPGNSTPPTAQMSFRVTFKTQIAGNLVRDMTADVKLESNQWRIAWNDGLILPELKGGNQLKLDYNMPARGIIYDNGGKPLVTQTDVMALAINPARLDDGEATLVGELSRLTGLTPGNIVGLYDAKRGVDVYVPVGEAPLEEYNKHINLVSGLGGLISSQYNSRFYYDGGIAPQAVGYVSSVPREQLDQYIRQGYSPAARIGFAGIERWGENLLAGKTGANLYVVGPAPDYKIISTLATTESKPASSIHLTIDRSLQEQAQQAIVGFRGSIVVLERDTGKVLAMVSSPGYDPNLFDLNNENGRQTLGNLINDPDNPLYNRAVQGQYPLGSVFKVITFSAALESGTYTPETKYECGYEFTELADRTLYDWTYEHMQNEIAAGDPPPYTQPSGTLTLTGGLMRSCNPYFYHIGRDLFLQGRVSAVADMARGFGLGKETGIGQLEESPGAIINPTNELEATNQAIGQGDVLVTPLQVADFMAAIGNGGTLYRPQIVEKTVDANGVETTVFKPESRGVLPVKPETLAALRTAMLAVVRNSRGTAYSRFTNLKEISIYGKTGTAETNGTSHAWFAGYTDEQNPDRPDIAIAVIAENAGEGSIIAAPIFKRVVEIYFYGKPLSPYRWETYIGATKTPTPFGFEGTQTAEAPNPSP